MSIFNALTSLGSEVVAAATDLIVNKTDLEKKLDEALSRQKWGATHTLLREIAAATRDRQSFQVIMRTVWQSLDPHACHWRIVYKALVLLDTLLKHGEVRVVDDAREHGFRLRSLRDFQHMEDGHDQAVGIRELATKLGELLESTEGLREARRVAKATTRAHRSRVTPLGG